MPHVRLACALLVTGCFGTHDGPSTRVTATRYAPEGGGEPSFVAWHDHELDVDCAFVVDERGDRYCMPLGGHTFSRQLVYADPACTDAHVRVTDECGPSRFALVWRYGEDWTGCGPRPADRPFMDYEPYEVGAPTALERGYRLEADGTCAPLDSVEGEHRALRRIDLSELVRGGYVEPSAPGLSLEEFRTEEGVAVHNGFVDREAGRCGYPLGWRLDRVPPARVPCVIGDRVEVWRDRGLCPSPHGLHRQPECGAPDAELAVEVVPDDCYHTAGYALHRVGETLPSTELPDGCHVPDGAAYVTLEPAAEDDGVWLDRIQSGDGRLRNYALAHGELTSPLGLYEDTELGFACRPLRTTDGDIVCAPGLEAIFLGASSTDLFSDPACTAPATLWDECEPYQLQMSHCGWPALIAAYRTADPVERVYREDDTGACVEEEISEGSQAYALEEIPLSSLARFTPVAGE